MLRVWLRWRERAVVAVAGSVVALGSFVGVTWAAGLPDGRAYELVSPGDKLGNDVLAFSARTHAAAGESDRLPAAVSFASLGAFVDVQGTGIATEFLAQRDGLAGTSGWSAHAITPRQEPLPLIAVIRGLEPLYQGEMSDDLTKGVFQAWSPLGAAPNVAHVPNLYAREDLRTPGAGFYRLLSDAPTLLPAPNAVSTAPHPFFVESTQDAQHMLFESNQPLTTDATPGYVKLYKTDGTVTRLVAAGAGCPGGSTRFTGPCSAAGLGATATRYTQRVLSRDGRRTLFTAPVAAGGGVTSRPGSVSKVFQLDDRGTLARADDAIVQVNTSEKSSADTARAAGYQIASVDGARVFFTSTEQLTDSPGGGLYMWERQPTNETQAVTVDAVAGTFTLTFHSQLSTGVGDLTNGSRVVGAIDGSFALGQTVSGSGIPAGTTVAAIGASSLTLSEDATATGTEAVSAAVDATTAPLAHDATAGEVQSALEALTGIGAGNVTVTGGSGGPSGSSPYAVTFTGALAGVNVASLTANSSGLAGGAASASVTTTRPLHNLTQIAAFPVSDSTGGIGASEDGHHLYFAAAGAQLVSGGPSVRERGLYYWADADGVPGGTLSFIGGVQAGDVSNVINLGIVGSGPRLARVTPDGRILMFSVSDGTDLAPRYDQLSCPEAGSNANNNTGSGCSEVYVYSAAGSTPTVPKLVCASCNPSGSPAIGNAWINIRRGVSGTAGTTHLSRALSGDGRRVFFSTEESLVPEDTNGKFDAYEYDVPSATAHLISTGLDTADSYFLDASADGHDVYFATREHLVGWDTDRAYDLYDARVGGGFPDPPAPVKECEADACHGATAVGPAVGALGSSAFRGLGNATSSGTIRRVRRALRCKRSQVKRRVKGRTRCVRRTRAKRSKRAKHHAAARRSR